MAAHRIRLAVIGGDGIGPEVVAEAIKVLRAVGTIDIDPTSYDLGSERYNRTGEVLPKSVLAEMAGQDAILLGAVGDPSVPSGVLERGLLLRLRFEFDQYVNLRPVRLYPGVASPLSGLRSQAVDMLVVREGTEGPYTGTGGAIRVGNTGEAAEEGQVFEGREVVVDADAVAEIADPAVDVDSALRRFRETREDAQQRGLPRPVAADESNARTLDHLEVGAA